MMAAALAIFVGLVRFLCGCLVVLAFVLVFGDQRVDDGAVILHARARGLAVGLAFWFALWVTS